VVKTDAAATVNVKESDFADLIGRIYDAALDPRRWPDVLDGLSMAFHGNAILFFQDLRQKDSAAMEFVGFEPEFIRSYTEHYGRLNPWLPRLQQTPAGAVVVAERLSDPASYEGTEFYNDWVRPQGLYSAIGSILARNDAAVANLSVNRRAAAGAPSEAEIAAFARLVPHLRRALQMHMRLASLTLQRDSAAQGLDGLSLGVVLVDGSCRVLYANRTAEALLRTGDGLIARQGRLGAVRSNVTRDLERLIAEAAATGAGRENGTGGVIALPRRQGGATPLSALVCPLRAPPAGNPLRDVARGAGSRRVPAALVFVGDPDRATDNAPAAAVLARHYGLTPSEAGLFAALLHGQRLADYAEELGISINTAKARLRHLFAKTGTDRQVDLLRLVLTDPILRLSAAG
jgi:DNA-binding CsgD family transcriptional regulator